MTFVDPGVLGRRLTEWLPDGLVLGPGRIVSEHAQERAVLWYSTAGNGGAGPDLVVKVYADPARAARLDGLLRTVAGVPRPVAHVPTLGACVYEATRGHTLDQLPVGDQPAAVKAAAVWLAALHRDDRLRFDRALDVDLEVENARVWADEVDSGDARKLADRLQHRPAMPALRPMHKDFQYQHTLFDGERLTVIDLDEMRAGDPGLDVAHFAANLRLLERRGGGSGLEDRFVLAYGGPPSEERHRFWLSYTFLKLAKQLVRGRGPLPVPAGADRDDEVAWALSEGLR